MVSKLCIDLSSAYLRSITEHIGKHLFDIYSMKGNENAGTLLVFLLGHRLIFRTVTVHMTAEIRIGGSLQRFHVCDAW